MINKIRILWNEWQLNRAIKAQQATMDRHPLVGEENMPAWVRQTRREMYRDFRTGKALGVAPEPDYIKGLRQAALYGKPDIKAEAQAKLHALMFTGIHDDTEMENTDVGSK